MMPPSGGATQTGTGHSYQTYQDFSYEVSGLRAMMPPSGGATQTGTGHSYQTYQDFSYEEGGQGGQGAGMAAGGYDYDAAYDDEYPPQQPYPHPGIRGLQYGGDGRQYAAGGLPNPPQWGYEEEGYGGGYGEDEERELGWPRCPLSKDRRQWRQHRGRNLQRDTRRWRGSESVVSSRRQEGRTRLASSRLPSWG